MKEDIADYESSQEPEIMVLYSYTASRGWTAILKSRIGRTEKKLRTSRGPWTGKQADYLFLKREVAGILEAVQNSQN